MITNEADESHVQIIKESIHDFSKGGPEIEVKEYEIEGDKKEETGPYWSKMNNFSQRFENLMPKFV